MKFTVGPETYRVRITEDRIFMNGVECLGLAVYRTREILLSPALPPKHRMATLLHEIRHAWQFHFPGTSSTAEDEATTSSSIMMSIMRDLVDQGGAAAVERLQCVPDVPTEDEPAPECEPEPCGPRYVPLDQAEQSETPAMSRAGRAQCGRCEMIVADGSIVTGDVHWDDEAKGCVVHRQMFCPHCFHVQEWDEGANLAGIPNGAVVRGPDYRVGLDVEIFLAEHPRAVGMITA